MSSAPDVPLIFRDGPSDPIRLADQPGTWVETTIAAPVEQVWELVCDIELPARFSTEFLGATWDGDGEPGVGSTFTGSNRHPAIGEWQVTSFVEDYEPGVVFGWATIDADDPGSRWRFDLAPADGGTTLRYSMWIGPGPSGISMPIQAMPDKEPKILVRRVAEHHGNMQRTVDGIRELAEGPR